MCRCPLQFFKRSNDGTPTPVSRSMPAVLAAQRDRHLAEERAETAVNHAEEDREHRGVREVIPFAGSNPSRPIPSGDNETTPSFSWSCHDSLGIATFFNVSMVPREFSASEDYRWNLIMYARSGTSNSCSAQFNGPLTLCCRVCRSSGMSTISESSTTLTWFVGDVSVSRP